MENTKKSEKITISFKVNAKEYEIFKQNLHQIRSTPASNLNKHIRDFNQLAEDLIEDWGL